ncbi:class I SAM-dependent methyltransferase [Pseudodonghicola xiamenensis]|uniref:MFS transporter n=1 Tax=Pseudodonghicola xiamenensis TaxID=337702 RepID=A0A8J3H859_9RHOB|nr:class I SAM-dependent methyltransferase [Pseudodonghicola xiamenensis]GHG88964.1 MFS transporter [Pseudodonghicola xiamenensis]
MTVRLALAVGEGGLTLPETGPLAVFHPRASADLSVLPRDRALLIQPFRPDYDALAAAGWAVDSQLPQDMRCAAALVFLPRAKRQAQALIARAAACCDGLVVVDGAKTDGADSLWREVRKRVPVLGSLSKAHGRLFWFQADEGAFADWVEPAAQGVEGFVTAPGVFSADGVDPASRLLVESLPPHLGAHLADLGAGWGYLSTHLLRDDRLKTLEVVEADRIALNCAERNITDPRARFHWADATGFKPDQPLDAVVMNPPFHTDRNADPGLGQAFILAAARMLAPRGQLWLVANRHLPYETTLAQVFAEHQEVAGDSRFKILHAVRPVRLRA